MRIVSQPGRILRSGRRQAIWTASLALGLLALLPAGVVAKDGPFIPSTHLLPPIVPTAASPDRAEACGPQGLICVRWVETQLARWERYFGCDHRAVFPTVYRLLTRETRLFLEQAPSQFDDPAGLGYEAVRFYELYHDMITGHLAGEPIPPAWQRAMSAARSGDWTGGHDMLLAINAHVQRDMPFAVAATGLNLPDGRSRKPDHDEFNRVLNGAYDTIVQAVGRRYDPLIAEVDDVGLLIDNIGAQQLVALWREGVWRNAERIVSTANTPLWELTVLSIETTAEVSALAMKVGEIPGHRERRDAHCETVLGRPAEPPNRPPPDDIGSSNPIRDAR